jgi:hypothetical protein
MAKKDCITYSDLYSFLRVIVALGVCFLLLYGAYREGYSSGYKEGSAGTYKRINASVGEVCRNLKEHSTKEAVRGCRSAFWSF